MVPFCNKTSNRKDVNSTFYSPWLDLTWNEPKSIALVAEAQSTQPLIGISKHAT